MSVLSLSIDFKLLFSTVLSAAMLLMLVLIEVWSLSMFVISLACWAFIVETIPALCAMLVTSDYCYDLRDWSRAVLDLYYDERVLVSDSSFACVL